MHTSCANIVKLLRITCTELMIFFTHVWNFFKTAQASELITWSAMSSLFSLQSDMIKSQCIINMFMISWKIWLINFFYISFISFLFIIFMKILSFLQSDNKSSLNHCFFTVASSFITLIHDDNLNVKYIFSCICNYLLRSCINVFNFYTFFAMNASWLLIFFFEAFWRCWINIKITSFHEWSLLFSFSNINVCVNKFMMLIMFISSLHKHLNFLSLLFCDESTLLVIITESALLLLIWFIIIYSSTWFLLFHL